MEIGIHSIQLLLAVRNEHTMLRLTLILATDETENAKSTIQEVVPMLKNFT